MQQCEHHVSYQPPNEYTRVYNILNSTHFNGEDVHAAVSMMNNDIIKNGKMNNFEETTTYLLPAESVSKKRKEGTKINQAKVFKMIVDTGTDIYETQYKPSRCKTGVEFTPTW